MTTTATSASIPADRGGNADDGGQVRIVLALCRLQQSEGHEEQAHQNSGKKPEDKHSARSTAC